MSRPFRWPGGLVVGSAAVAAVLILRTTNPRADALFLAVTAYATVALLIGVRRHRPGVRGAWWPVPACALATLAAGFLYLPLTSYDGVEAPTPSDFAHLAFYPLIVSAVLFVLPTRASRHERSSLVEALIVACALATVAWICAGPSRQDDTDALVYINLVLLPLLNLLPLALVLRRRMPNRTQPTAFYLYTSMFGMTLTVDVTFVLNALRGDPVSLPLAAVWWSLRVGAAVAAQHPSMARLVHPSPDAGPLPRGRLLLLGCSAATGPVLLLVLWAHGDPLYLPFIVCATVITIALVIARMAQMLRANERARRLAETLQTASAALVGALDRSRVASAAVAAGEELFEAEGNARILLALLEGDELVVRARTARGPAEGTRLEGVVAGAGRLDVDACSELLAARLGGDPTVCVPLTGSEGCLGLLAVATRRRLDRQLSGAASALASAVTLAIQRGQYAENLVLKRGQERLAALVRNAADVILVVDGQGRLTYASPSAASVFGRDPAELPGLDPLTLLDPDGGRRWTWTGLAEASAGGPARISGRIRHPSGERKYVDATVANLLEDSDIAGLVLTVRDITDRVELEEALEHQAHHDHLTGLANRALFNARLGEAVQHARGDGFAVGVLMVDLDDFKTVNDSLGHGAGDELLVIVARRLRNCIREDDLAARLGGDEFAVLLTGADVRARVDDVARGLIDACGTPVVLDGRTVRTACTVGVAVTPGGEQAEDLVRNADAAMYVAKREGKGRVAVFTQDMHAEALRRLELKNDLAQALERGEFELHYQPIMELATRTAFGWEALLRWNHPVRGPIGPNDFIPVAEETGLIVPIGRWVLRTACAQMAAWGERWPEAPLSVSVNVSPRQFAAEDLVGDVVEALRSHDLDPSALLLEVTENSLIEDPDGAFGTFAALREHGVSIAIDDFGTGYSSLSYLQRFPVDVIKIDRSFVRMLAHPDGDPRAIFGILALARTMSLRTVAEGIEQVEELEQLLRAGCGYGQGWLFAHPMPVAEAERFIADMVRDGRAA